MATEAIVARVVIAPNAAETVLIKAAVLMAAKSLPGPKNPRSLKSPNNGRGTFEAGSTPCRDGLNLSAIPLRFRSLKFQISNLPSLSAPLFSLFAPVQIPHSITATK
jgi:hypothetical protein